MPISDINNSDPQAPLIVGLRPAVTGAFITLQCQKCNHTFENYQPTVAGVGLGRHNCPQCQSSYIIRPGNFEQALTEYLPKLEIDDMVQMTKEASRITETWYENPLLAELFTYRGLNLGEPAERVLLSWITLGLYQARLQQET